ncbi:PBP1A family penicillin-binding protein [Candidatus Wolfebacteria bacterium]|nr:PBP1A family penicillin-binding protein [Candidatus Wolfebacteria bacterium]
MVNKKRKWWLKFLILFLLIAVAALFFVLSWLAKLAKELPNPEQFVSRQIDQSTKIYDRTGKVLLYEVYGEEKRTVIPFNEIPDYAKKATLTIEDRGFYEHNAFDWRAIIRAAAVNIIKGQVVQGGSTITQQLAKNAFLNPEQTMTRKAKELILAYWIEKQYSKDEILNLYLNQIPYGSNVYGIEAAAQTFFSKQAKDLSLAEAATLAALPKAPSYYSPWGSHKNELDQRKNYILDQMFQLGLIDEEEKTRSQNAKIEFTRPSIGSIKAPHFVMIARDYLNNKYGEDIVEKGGLKVITTLDWKLQEVAEATIKEGAERNAQLYQGKNAALVAQDSKTGQILALVGSKDYYETESIDGNFNVAVDGLRQPGSTIKPLAYVTAFQKGYKPNTVVFDLPTEFSTYRILCPLININFSNSDRNCFHPQNFDHVFRGPVTLKEALAQSINVPAVKTLYLAGLNDTIQTAKNFGINTLTDPNRYGLSLVLGGGEVKLIEMVGAYAVFSQNGVKHNQSIILEVKNSKGEVLEKFNDAATKVIEEEYALLINDILSDPEARKPLFQNSIDLTVFPDRAVALKTGTTDDYKDAWTIGYTPSLTVGVWAGNNNNKPMQKNAGSILAALPIWHSFLSKIIEGFPVEEFKKIERQADDDKSSNPMINGQYLTEAGVHNILYYTDKNNPLGPAPANPQDDSQFLNWELPVAEWLKTNNGFSNRL